MRLPFEILYQRLVLKITIMVSTAEGIVTISNVTGTIMSRTAYVAYREEHAYLGQGDSRDLHPETNATEISLSLRSSGSTFDFTRRPAAFDFIKQFIESAVCAVVSQYNLILIERAEIGGASAALMTGIALRFGSTWLMSRQIVSSCLRI